jgi:hypothetical protein
MNSELSRSKIIRRLCTSTAINVARSLLLPVIAFHAAAQTPLTNLGPSHVSVSGRQLLVQRRNLDGTLGPATPYAIRGVCWSPAGTNTATSAADPNNVTVRRVEFANWYQADIPLLKAMNVNTVRTFMDFGFDSTLGPKGLAILDQLYTNGIMVIMTVDDANNNTNRLTQAVTYYRNHPAILMWSLGSEWSVNLYFNTNNPTAQIAAQHTEQAAQLVKSLDTLHPVVSSYGDMDGNIATFATNTCPSVDVWSFNVYRGASFGDIFNSWASISPKPMFLGEFGIDAFHSIVPEQFPSGVVNENEQKQYDSAMWDEIDANLSSANSTNVCLGGTVFEWCDEWWKSPLWQTQDTGGWFPLGFPDSQASEDIFGIVDINRSPRQAYYALQSAFDLGYAPPPIHYSSFSAVSRGARAALVPGSIGSAEFSRGGLKFYARAGGGGGGRGFNVAVLDPNTGNLLQPVQNFGTWGSPGIAHTAMINFLDSLPNGTLLLIAVADEAGLNYFPPNDCQFQSVSYVTNLMQKLESLGSTQISNYCYWSSWAMITYKGEGRARGEGVSVAGPVTLGIHINGTLSISSISDQWTTVGIPTLQIPFDVDDHVTPASNLIVSATSSNPVLVPNANITLGGAGIHRTITVAPIPQQSGQATITLTVTDGNGISASNSFALFTRPLLINPRMGQNGFSVSLRTINDRMYGLQIGFSLVSGLWYFNSYFLVIGDGSVITLTDTNAMFSNERYYRVQAE